MGQYYPDSMYTRPVNFHAAVVDIDERRQPLNESGVRCTRDYINGLPTPVRVCTRNGLVFTLSAEPRATARSFMSRDQVTWTRDTDLDPNLLAQTFGLTAEAWKKAIAKQDNSAFHLCAAVPVVTEVSWNDFNENGKTLYIEELDVVLSIDPKAVLVHPYSELGSANRVADSVAEADIPDTASLVLRIVDHSSKLSPKFANICGDIYRVPAVAADVPEGLYVIRNSMATGGFKSQSATVTHVPFDKIDDTFPLFDSMEEAKVLGDQAKLLDHARAMEVEELKRENTKLKLEDQEHRKDLQRLDREAKESQREWEEKKRVWEEQSDREKREFDERKRASEEDIRRRQEALDKLQAEMDQKSIIRKDVYEERSYERKDNLEYLKFLPLAIAGIMGLVLAFKKS